jgi:hypothetical protein
MRGQAERVGRGDSSLFPTSLTTFKPAPTGKAYALPVFFIKKLILSWQNKKSFVGKDILGYLLREKEVAP